MIYQVVLLGAVSVLASGYPQTFQYQRQVYYNPPVPALHRGVIPAPLPGQYIPQQQAEFIPSRKGGPNQPFVYVYSPDGQSRTGQVFILRQEGGGGTWYEPLLQGWQTLNNYLPSWGQSPQQPDKPTAPAESAEQPNKVEEGQGNASAESGASAETVTEPPAQENPQRERFFVVRPQASQFVGVPNQFLFRGQNPQDIMNDRAGDAAVNFQRFLALAKLKRKKGQSQEEMMDAEGAVAVDALQKEGQEETSTTEVESAEQDDHMEGGPSIAQAKPQAVSVAGPGGVAAAAPVATAVVGKGGMALSAPSATAVAGAKGKPGSPAKLKAFFKQANLPGYYVQY